MRNWKYRVVRRARGMQGQWFDYPTAATFETETEARVYAETFRDELVDLSTAYIDVRRRSGTCSYGRGSLVATYEWASDHGSRTREAS